MKIGNGARLRPSRIERAILRIEEDCQALNEDLTDLERSKPAGMADRPVLITDRVRQVRSLLDRFRSDKPRIKRRKVWFRVWRHGVILATATLGATLLVMGLGAGHDLSLIATSGVFLAALPLVLQLITDGTRIERAELETRREICRKRLHSVRAMLLVIDSHVAAKPLWKHWCPASEAPLTGTAPEPGNDRDGAYLHQSIAIRYPSIASSLARVCAKIAALYPQVLRDSELASEADALALIAFEIERVCLMKSELIRSVSTMPAHAGAEPRSAHRVRGTATAEQPFRQAA